MAEPILAGNPIPTIQNQDDQIRLLRAQQRLYSGAKRIVAMQMLLTLAVPLAGAALTLLWPEFKPVLAFLALVIAVLDISVFDRWQKRHLLTAAKVQEQFDCAVLELPWDRYTVGRPIEPETIHEAASELVTMGKARDLTDWYPPVVGRAPLHQARLICQRTNLWYDSKIRRRYGGLILSLIAGLAIVLLGIGVAGGITLTSFVLVVAAPATPVVSWGLREFFRQRDVADALDRLRAEAEGLWGRAKDGTCDPEDCAMQSRILQTAIFSRRATSPPVFDWLYRFLRSRTEDQMNVGAAAMVRELGITLDE